MNFDKLLLIIDMQYEFINNNTKHLIPKIEYLAKEYQFVMYSQFFNEEDSNFRKILQWEGCKRGTKEFECCLDLSFCSYRLLKNGYSCVNEEFLSYLQNNPKIKEIHICGVDTDACVFKTSLDLFEKNFKPVVLQEYCGSFAGDYYHKAGIEFIKRSIGSVL